MEPPWMQRALELAERGRGAVEPNPLVGAVVIRDGQMVSEGWHQRYGHAHAEVNALAAAGEQAKGATLYVTLEPCCHHGKTPPCTDAILQAGIRRVVAAMADPFPHVAGQGATLLRTGGVEVELGVCEPEARQLNTPYLKLLETGRPYVHAKWAMTLDGKIATASGDSRWISNEASRQRVHALRGGMDAIVVGIGTALADNPQLTARPPGPRMATRVVLDHQCRLPVCSILVETACQIPTLVVPGKGCPTKRMQALQDLGCEVLPCADVASLLIEMGHRRWTNVLVEGGSSVLASFLEADAIDEAHVFVAPCLAGGSGAITPIGGQGVARISDAMRLDVIAVENISGDIYWRGFVRHGFNSRSMKE
jgi:diaminohydroxyphosphoribosylaminopyrimidine deaminase / 5-amino-6-(5-phosphoribosylamino)uracil reductase